MNNFGTIIGLAIIASIIAIAIPLFLQYFIIKAAVRNGIKEAREDALERMEEDE